MKQKVEWCLSDLKKHFGEKAYSTLDKDELLIAIAIWDVGFSRAKVETIHCMREYELIYGKIFELGEDEV